MAYYLGRDVSVYIRSEDFVGVLPAGTLDFTGNGTNAVEFSAKAGAGLQVTDLTGVDLGIGVTDEDITYIGSKTVLKAEIKKETTLSLTRKKKDNVWDVVFNGDGTNVARWGTGTDGAIANLAGEPSTTSTGGDTLSFGYALKLVLASTESITVPNMQITAHTVSLNADGTTEETLELISHEDPVIAA